MQVLPDQYEFMIFLGTNHTGKTTEMKKYMKLNDRNLVIPANGFDPAWKGIKELGWKRALVKDKLTGKKKVVAKIPELNTFRGTRKLIITEETKFLWERILDQNDPYRDGSLFMDDFSNYIQPGITLPAKVTSLLGDRRHRKLDIFMATHSIKKVNPDFFDYGPKLVIKKITRPITNAIANKIENPEELKELANRVKEKAQDNPYYYEIFQAEV